MVMAATLGVDRAKAVAERLSCVTSVGRGRGAVAVLNICRDGVYAGHIFAAAGIGAVFYVPAVGFDSEFGQIVGVVIIVAVPRNVWRPSKASGSVNCQVKCNRISKWISAGVL